MHQKSYFFGVAMLLLAAFVCGLFGPAHAQYPGTYSYYANPQPVAPRGPNLAGGLSTYGRNPLYSQQSRPTGMVTSTNYGMRAPTRTNPFVHQPAQKPFSNLQKPRPLVSSMDAARIEVARGLWGGGW